MKQVEILLPGQLDLDGMVHNTTGLADYTGKLDSVVIIHKEALSVIENISKYYLTVIVDDDGINLKVDLISYQLCHFHC